MNQSELFKEVLENIRKEIKSQNDEIIKIAERVGDKERKKIGDRISIDSDIADGFKNIVSNIDRLEQMISAVNQRVFEVNQRVTELAKHTYPYV
jgi:prefoldin subunit 5